MGYFISNEKFDQIMNKMREKYRIYAPKRFEGQGRYSDTDIIRYDEIGSTKEIVYDIKSTYPVKEVLMPLNQTIMYFTEGKYTESQLKDEREILIFARACDINAIKRFDDIYLKNGNYEDPYYKRVREKTKFILMECPANGWDTCFCVSMEANKAEEYIFGVKFLDEGVMLENKENEFNEYFSENEKNDFTVTPVYENQREVRIPEINSKEIENKIKSLDMWKEYDKRCLECGSCTVACSTCTCFTTYDINYSSDTDAGERRRMQASCHIDGFTSIAGGHSFRNTPGDKMRFKVLHKIYDHKVLFKEHQMCVGCGRCDERCPVSISFIHTVNRLAQEVDKLNKEVK